MGNSPFLFSEEQDMFRETVGRLAQTEFREGYLARATSSEYPRDALAILAKNGLLSLAIDWKSTRLNSSHIPLSRMPSSA